MKLLLKSLFLGLVIAASPLLSQAEKSCKSTLAGANFLHQMDKGLAKSTLVEAEQKRLNRKGQKTSQDSAQKIKSWIELLERTHFAESRDQERVKAIYLKKHVIKADEIPKSYFKTQIRIARELGHGTQELTDDLKRQLTKIAINDQTTSLSLWLDHFLFAEETSIYPMWLKYWVFNNMLKLGVFDPVKKRFSKRSHSQVAPFAELNHEAIGYVMDAVLAKVNKTSFNEIQDPDFLKYLETANFRELYAKALILSTLSPENLDVAEGKWVKFNQDSDPKRLVATLQGKGTGWCTAGIATASIQLKLGDFYAFYTKDTNGDYSVPRLAIRMEGDKIAEVRGIGENQNLDSVMAGESTLEEKLKEFGNEGKAYKKKSSDMKQLTRIENKHRDNEELSLDELKFLYEIDNYIVGFGNGRDPRIEEIRKKRIPEKDYAKIYDVEVSEVTRSKKVALEGKASIFVGFFKYEKGDDLSNLRLRVIHGDAQFNELESSSGLESLELITGAGDFVSLIDASDLSSLKKIGGRGSFRSLVNSKGLSSLSYIGVYAGFQSLVNAQALTSLEYIGDSASFRSLVNSKGLSALRYVGSSIEFNVLTDAKGLTALEHVGVHASFMSLVDAEGLSSLSHIGYIASFESLKDPSGLSSLSYIGSKIQSRFNSLEKWRWVSSDNGGYGHFEAL